MIWIFFSGLTLYVALRIVNFVSEQEKQLNDGYEPTLLFSLWKFFLIANFVIALGFPDVFSQSVSFLISFKLSYVYLYIPYKLIERLPIEENKVPEKSVLGRGVGFLVPENPSLRVYRNAYSRFTVYKDIIVIRVPLHTTKVLARSDLIELEFRIWWQAWLVKFRDGTIVIVGNVPKFIDLLEEIAKDNQGLAKEEVSSAVSSCNV